MDQAESNYEAFWWISVTIDFGYNTTPLPAIIFKLHWGGVKL